MSVKIDSRLFHRRASRAFDLLLADPTAFGPADALVIAVGASSEETQYQKGPSFQTWLLGYEFTDTIVALTPSRNVIFMTSAKKASYLEPLSAPGNPNKVSIITRPKDSVPFNQLWATVKASSHNLKSIAVVKKDILSGKFAAEWKLEQERCGFSIVDGSVGVSMCLGVKEGIELGYIGTAAKVAAAIMKNHFVEEMSTIVDEERKVTHSELSEQMENGIANEPEKLAKKCGFPADVDLSVLDYCYTPIIQSGGEYDLRPSAQSSDKPLHSGIIICSLGIRYHDYCSNVTRTFLIDPTKTQERNYNFLVSLHSHITTDLLAVGARCCDVYRGAVDFIRKRRPELEAHLPRNLGFGMGLEFRESMYSLSAANETRIPNSSTFNLAVGLQNLEDASAKDPRSRKYALLISDTVSVSLEKRVVLTSRAPRDDNAVIFYIDDDENNNANGKPNQTGNAERSRKGPDSSSKAPGSKSRDHGAAQKNRDGKSNREGGDEDEDEDEDSDDDDDDERRRNRQGSGINDITRGTTRLNIGERGSGARVATSAILTTKRRRNAGEVENEAKRRQNQLELARAKQEEGLRRFMSSEERSNEMQKPLIRKFESYKNMAGLPREAGLRIYVDTRFSTLVLPLHGSCVPFHISTIKNLSKSDEGEYVSLRLNFVFPGQATSRKDAQPFEDANATFVKSLTYRSTDAVRMNEIYRQISELKKQAQKEEAEAKDKIDIVEQGELQEIRSHQTITLHDVFARPTLDSKRMPGDLQIHVNGLRYVSRLKPQNKIEVLFKNIQHLIFQPCENELIVLLHLHLKNPIMIGKKKTKDVQFYREASDAAFDETGNRRRKNVYGDEDELQQEQEEKKRKILMNKEFKEFGEKIVAAQDGRLELDIPFRDLAFDGVPGRSNVLLQPTAECLVFLSDLPFLVLTLSDVEIVHFERVNFGLRNFDMVFVFSDFSRPPQHINTVPAKELENIKDWLNSMGILYYEGEINLNWTEIMKTINADPTEFFNAGGWNFLADNPGSGSEGGSDSEDSEGGVDVDKLAAAETESESDYDSDEDSEEDEDSDEEDDESDYSESDADSDESDDEDYRRSSKKANANARRR